MPLKESAACFQLVLNDAAKKTQKHLSSPQSP